MMVEPFRRVGMTLVRKRLNSPVRISAIWSVQALTTSPGMLLAPLLRLEERFTENCPEF